ncbi:MAG: hypothetical protein R3272_10270 [Candidatus Promineifilaceae bacterium]|nr:hypothetical protein [Candidatus Promineifilaceae bacterium]
MTENLLLDGAATTFSLFNTLLLFWLGVTVLLNAERRTWGIWLAGIGLLSGGGFFFTHTAILSQAPDSPLWRLGFWWYTGLALTVAMPLSWYLVMLWYSGFWHEEASALRRRQHPWLLLILAIAVVGTVAMVVVAGSFRAGPPALPAFISRLNQASWIVGAYAFYLVACNLLAVDALLRPGPSVRLMGALARRRARRWLLLASFLLLLVSFAVVIFLVWALKSIPPAANAPLADAFLSRTGQFDLLISLLISAAVVAIGQAVVAYEIFTGKSLPRGGLRRQWRQVLLLAALFSLLTGAALALPLRPVYVVLLAALLMAGSVALLNRVADNERQRYVDHLRPFIASQNLYDRFLSSPTPTNASFQLLCRDILGARRAFLVPLGALAPLAGKPLQYPTDSRGELPAFTTLMDYFSSPRQLSFSINPALWGGASWAIPLWGTRGLIGVLLLGEKKDGSLYTQEEMEIARASGERLIDTRASGEMGRQLLELQRRRLAATQIADRRTRRVLHDDVLPHLHAALLALSSGESDAAISLLSRAHREISDLLRDVPATTTPTVMRLGVLGALRQTVEKELAGAFDAISWEVEPAAEQRVRALSSLESEVLFYAAREAIRNAARHGRGAGEHEQEPLHLLISAYRRHAHLELSVEDNGIGVAPDAGPDEGRGLALHSTMMAIIGGTLVLESEPRHFTRVRLTLPDVIAGSDLL